jgi:hypothetical protein
MKVLGSVVIGALNVGSDDAGQKLYYGHSNVTCMLVVVERVITVHGRDSLNVIEKLQLDVVIELDVVGVSLLLRHVDIEFRQCDSVSSLFQDSLV